MHWVRRMHSDAGYNASFHPYLATLPAADEVLSPEMWSDDMVAALQSSELVRSDCVRLPTQPLALPLTGPSLLTAA